MLNSIIKAALGDYAHKGFKAQESRDDLELSHDGETFIRMQSGLATIIEIRRQCLNHLIVNHGIEY